MSSLGMAIGSPLVGLVITRVGALAVIAASVLSLAVGLLVISVMTSHSLLFGFTTFTLGFMTVATTPIGYFALIQRFSIGDSESP